LEFSFRQIYLRQELPSLITVHSCYLRVVWEVQQDVGKFHVSVDHVQLPNLDQTFDNLTQDQTYFRLTESLAHLKQNSQVGAIAVLHHHIDIRGSLDGLEETYRVVGLNQVVEAHFLLDAVHVLLGYADDFDDFTGVSLINLLLLLFVLLGFTNFSVLTNTKDLLNVDQVVSNFSDKRLSCWSWFLFAYSS